MKQHITQEQFEELSDIQKQKWIAWMLSKDTGNEIARTAVLVYTGQIQPLYRSIGDLICFLNNQREGTDERIEIGIRSTSPTTYWYIKMDAIKAYFNSVELVDALWMAVKEMLLLTKDK